MNSTMIQRAMNDVTDTTDIFFQFVVYRLGAAGAFQELHILSAELYKSSAFC